MVIKKFEYKYLGEIAQFSRGFDITKKEQNKGLFPVVSSGGVLSFNDKCKCKGPGVITGRKGTLGKVFYVDSDYWPHDTTLWIKDYKGNIPKYLYYLLSQLQLESFDVGASNPTLNRNHLHKIQVLFPKQKEIQNSISKILSVYDDLIETNIIRIKLLEEIIRELFKEWFIRKRFPGHEQIRFIKNVPENWQEIKVEKIIERISPGKRYELKTALSEGIVPILDQGESGIIGYHNDKPGLEASLDNPVIVFSNHTCYQKIIQFPFSSIQNVLPFKPNPIKSLYRNIYWLHYATEGLIEFSEYKGHWPEFISKKLYLPPFELCEKFGDFARPIVQNIFIIEQQNNQLNQIKNRLLPRLISGKLEIKLDSKTAEMK